MSEKPTLKTIAALSGLAVPTVSRALGDAPDISAETKKRVRGIAARIGYVPNRAGVRLRTGRTGVISLVLSTENEVMDMTARLISSITRGLRGTSYHLNITPFFPGDDRMAPIRYIVETGAADAVILNQIEPEDPRVDYLMERRFPFATHGRSRRAAEHAFFDFDNTAFARLGIARLAARGRRRILLLAPPDQESYAVDMSQGAIAAAHNASVEVIVAQGVSSDSSIEEIRSAVARLVAQERTLDGLLVGAPVAAMAAVAGFEACGQVVGESFDVVSKDAISFLRLFRDPIMIIEEDVGKAGEFLARAALQAILKPDEPPLQFLDVPTAYAGT
jgi:LacI family transcriptional regulator